MTIDESNLVSSSSPSSSVSIEGIVESLETKQGMAWVLDDIISNEVLEWIDSFRTSLPLDSKRPTVDRRFFIDQKIESPNDTNDLDSARLPSSIPDSHRPIASYLEEILNRHLSYPMEHDTTTTKDNTRQDKPQLPTPMCHIFRYQRFLEYTKSGSELPPHSDGTKICDDTGRISTHTLLLYMMDCEEGGHTLLLETASLGQKLFRKKISSDSEDDYKKVSSKDNEMNRHQTDGRQQNYNCIVHAIQPRRGRILLFPHATPHAGAPVVSTPKVCLRAEVSVFSP
jgi:hypothetical protein